MENQQASETSMPKTRNLTDEGSGFLTWAGVVVTLSLLLVISSNH
jgi:hypothetical protein